MRGCGFAYLSKEGLIGRGSDQARGARSGSGRQQTHLNDAESIVNNTHRITGYRTSVPACGGRELARHAERDVRNMGETRHPARFAGGCRRKRQHRELVREPPRLSLKNMFEQARGEGCVMDFRLDFP